MKTILTLILILSFNTARADILFCDFDNIGRIGIRDVGHDKVGVRMQESWLTTRQTPYTRFELEKISVDEVNDYNIKVTFSALSKEQKDRVTFSLDLERKEVELQECPTWYGQPRPCYTRIQTQYLGQLKLTSKKDSYSGNTKCVWQYKGI